MSDYINAAMLAQAAWKDLNAKQSEYQAAVLRAEVTGDRDAAEKVRQEAHDMLDTCFDMNAEAARAQMTLLKR
ncbi:hypothetical protein ASG17_07595 [Brevundimonas sp. Leaf363]|uniref:hypothetical protein n=1 Tax=Brevundimonas sp. Leaf363 TaxID=1736353 RepID=UPI0006FD24ED|nr:hypothetical protein [Brevundimonas sp. Leaf363]KQS55905.1 hypothetical protein ASG17_07595 [Brevundimonas sp. Leaf363]